jgi:hypothetical protein
MSKREEDSLGSADYAVHDGLQMSARFRQRKDTVLNEPLTTMDPRSSSPNAVATGREEAQHVLETAMRYWLYASTSSRGQYLHHVARFGGARAGSRCRQLNLLACFSETPPVPAFSSLWGINLPL